MLLNASYNFLALLIILAALIHLLLPKQLQSKTIYAILVVPVALVILLLPASEAPVFYYLRGYIGDLSVTSSIFFAAYFIQKGLGRVLYRAIEVRYLTLTVLLLGLLLYPLSLGLGPFDPYRLGYSPNFLLILLFCSAIYLWYKAYYFLLFIVTSVVLGFTAGLLESNNLWDYLLDAVIWLICVSRILFSSLGTLVKKLRLRDN